MASFSETRGAARRVAGEITNNGNNLRAHSEQMAQTLRQSHARQNATAANAYGRATQMAAQSADFEHRAAMGAADANGRAGQKLSELMNTLTGSFITNARRVTQAEQQVEVAALKEQIQEESASGFVAGLSGKVDPSKGSAYQDAAKEGNAALLANNTLTTIGQRLSELDPGANGQDEVYRVVTEATEGMDPQTSEYFTKRVLEGAMPMVAKKSANDYLAARNEVEDSATAALLQDFTMGNIKTGADFTAAVDRTIAVRKGINPGQAKAGLFSTMRDYAKTVGKSADVLRLMEDTGMDERHPQVAAEIAVNAQAERLAAHKAGAVGVAMDVESKLAQLGPVDLYDPQAEGLLASAATDIAMSTKTYGRHDSLSSAGKAVQSKIEAMAKAKGEHAEWTRWVESGGTAEIDVKVRDKYESAQYKGLLTAVEQAAINGDTDALVMLGQRHKAHIARVGFMPREIVSSILGVVNVDLDYAYKDKNDRAAFLTTSEAKLRLLFEADATAGDGRVLASAFGDDDVSLAKANYLKSVHESGGSIKDAMLTLSRMTQPGQFRDAVDAMANGGLDAHLKAVDMTGPEIVSGALDPSGLFNSLDVNIADNPALANKILGAYRTHLTIFGGAGVDPSVAHEKALAHAQEYAKGITTVLPTADGDMAVHIPSRAVRDQLRTPVGGKAPGVIITENVADGKAALVAAYEAVKGDTSGWMGEDLPAALDTEMFVDPKSIGPDGSMRVVSDNGVTPVILGPSELDNYTWTAPDGSMVTGAESVNALLKPSNMYLAPNGYGQFEVMYRYDQANLDAQAAEKLRANIKTKEDAYKANAGARREFPKRLLGPDPSTWNGQNLMEEPPSDEIIGGTGDDRLPTSNFQSLVDMVSGDWAVAGTASNKRTRTISRAVNDVFRSITETIRGEGLVAPSLGGTRNIPEVTTFEEGMATIQNEINDHQINRHAGVPVDPKSGKIEASYAYRRREVLKESEGDKGTKVYLDHKGIPTVGIGINLTAPQNVKFIKENFSGTAEDYISGKRKFSDEQVEILFEYNMTLAEAVVNRKIGKVALTANQRLALVSLAFNLPGLIGPNLTQMIKDQKWEEVENGIRRYSNKQKHKGLQNRRNREADLFAMDTHTPSSHFNFS